MVSNSHETFAEAYVAGIDALLSHGEPVPSVEDTYSVGSDFGKAIRPTLELLGYGFTVREPEKCLLWWSGRPLRLAYCVGSLLWTLTGSDDLSWIGYYNPRAADFSDDGQRIAAAFGKRLLAFEDHTDQIGAVLKQLSSDRQSRRTVAVIASATDNTIETRGYPCAIAVQYLLRNDALHAITFMRSQSALMVLPYDGFLFMMIQQWLAHSMSVEVGTYTHVSGSFHIYEDEIPLAQEALHGKLEALSLGLVDGREPELQNLVNFEKTVRQFVYEQNAGAVLAAVHRELGAPRLPDSFSAQARLILLAHACETLNLSEQTDLTARSWETLRGEQAENGTP